MVNRGFRAFQKQLTQGLDGVKTELKQEMGEMKTELRQDIGSVRNELKQDVGGVREAVKTMAEEMDALHKDIRYIKSTVSAFARSDTAHDVKIEQLDTRVGRLERKASIAK